MMDTLKTENATEIIRAVLTRIWAELLGNVDVHPGDVFLALGGDSISAIVCVNRLRRELNVEVPIDTFLGDLTLSDCVDQIAAYAAAARPTQ